MAKKMRKILALVLVLAVAAANIVMPATAAPWSPPIFGGGNEWYEVYVQGSLVASGQGGWNDVYYLGTHYVADAYADGHMLYWYIDPQGSDNYFDGWVDLSKYITIPEGFSIDDIEIENKSIGGVNDPTHNMYDNCTISITIKALKNESGDIVEVPEETDVAVIHNYYTKDLRTNNTVKDGSVPSYAGATEGDTFTAIPVTTYNGNTYTQTGATPGMSITVNADASKNVITIDYLRTIDTTPAQTSVTVNHNYYTKDLRTGETVLDGKTSSTETAYEGDSYTATAATTYGGNTYTQTTDAALTISVVEDANQNVINIDYLRTIDTTPAQTSVTVNHNYYTKDLRTGETELDGSTTSVEEATENDSFTATPVMTYNNNAYTQSSVTPSLTIAVVADASQNVINIDYLRTIDTTPADTAATVIHTYYTKDLYTGETVKDGSSTTSVPNLKERDRFTASPVNTYGGNLYTQTTEASELVIVLVEDASQNVIYIDYLRTVDTTPKKTSVTVNHNYFTEDLYTGETVKDGSGSESFAATERDDFTAVAVTAYNGNDYTQTTDDAALTIKVVADATKNVIDINYLRTIDTTPIDYAPTVSVTKTADKATYEVGETITWTIQVTNTSSYVAYDVVVTDELVNGSWIIATLEPGGFRTFTATSEAAEAGQVKNVVVTSWTDGDEYPDAEETDEPKDANDEETVTVNEKPVPPTTEPPVVPPTTEPPATVSPTTEPPATEAPATENYEIAVASDDFYVEDDEGFVEILDEDVPLADVPQTGDMSALWIVLSAVSAGGAIVLNRKREED